MSDYFLTLNDDILALENDNKWDQVVDLVFKLWKADTNNINGLLCAGTEIWYSRLMVDEFKFDPLVPAGLEQKNPDQLESMLWDVASYGEKHFSKDANFNAYFGYMYKVMPHFFKGYQGDYDSWQKRGQNMLRRAAELDPQNLFAVAISYEIDSGSNRYRQACNNLWSRITPEQWGSSRVQQYFFRILDGCMYYPDAYKVYN